MVYWISYILFLSLAYLILKRMTAAARFFVPVVIILAALLLFWSTDIGRTDMLVAAILAGAALAAIDGRIITASLCVGAGFTVHEAVAIYGLPLLFAILLDEDRYKNVRLSSAAIGGAIIVVSFVAGTLIIPLLPVSDTKIIVQTIKSELPSSYLNESTDQSFFFLLTGARGGRLVQCVIQHSVHYFLHPFVAIFMIALATFSLSGLRHLRWTAPAVASVPPMLLLWLIASDMSRWTALEYSQRLDRVRRPKPSPRRQRIRLASGKGSLSCRSCRPSLSKHRPCVPCLWLPKSLDRNRRRKHFGSSRIQTFRRLRSDLALRLDRNRRRSLIAAQSCVL